LTPERSGSYDASIAAGESKKMPEAITVGSPAPDFAYGTAEGERDPAVVKAAMVEMIADEPIVGTEYVEAVAWESLEPVERMDGEVLIALAARVGKARLIDNILLEVPADASTFSP